MPLAETELSARIPPDCLDFLENEYGRGPRGRLFLPGTTLIEQGEPMNQMLIITRGQLLRIRRRPFGDYTSEIEDFDGTGYIVSALAVRGIENLVSPEAIRTTTDTRSFWFTPDEIRRWNGTAAPLGGMHGYIDLAAEERFRSLREVDSALMGNPLWTSRGLKPPARDGLVREPWCASTLRRFW